MLYLDLGRTGDAREALNRALAIYREHGATLGESRVLHSIATARMQQGRFDQALSTLDAALRLDRALGDPTSEAGTLASRALVHALIGLGKKAEALYDQALALAPNDPGIAATVLCNKERLRADEQDWTAAIALGRRCVEAQRRLGAIVSEIDAIQDEVRDLDELHADARLDPEQRRHARLVGEVDVLSGRLCQVISSLRRGLPASPSMVREARHGDPDMQRLVASLSARVAAPVALLQYLVSADQTFIVLTVAGSSRVEVIEVADEVLDDEVTDLLRRLVDRRLGYVPFAALHDGDGWLVERYTTVINAGLTGRARADTTVRSVAAFGASRFAAAGDESESACKLVPGALPSVRDEIEGIVRHAANDPDGVLPGAVFLDQAFSRQAFFDGASRGHSLLHVASHFVLDPDSAAASCLQLGDGQTLSLREIKAAALDLRHLDLITLSSCNTGIAGVDGEGLEIEALATVFLRQGARGVIASLWSVADASTAILMQSLYRQLSQDSELGKASALRKAQLALISGGYAASRANPVRGIYTAVNPSSESADYTDPFFWAPFVFIGH